MKFLFILLFSFSTYMFAQKIKYNDVKHDFSTKDYFKTIQNPKYSPIGAGIMNYFVPSSGYFYVGEPGRGVILLVSESILIGLLANNVKNHADNFSNTFDSFLSGGNSKSKPKNNAVPTGILIPMTVVVHFWSVFDVVKVAKVKNLAYQKQALSLKIEPNVEVIDMGGENGTGSYGLKLTYSF